MSDIRPYPPWWQDRYDALDDADLRYEHPLDDPDNPDFQPVLDVDEPRIDSDFDDREPHA